MTPASCDFISPLVLSTLSGNPVAVEFWNKKDGSWHVNQFVKKAILLSFRINKMTMSKGHYTN